MDEVQSAHRMLITVSAKVGSVCSGELTIWERRARSGVEICLPEHPQLVDIGRARTGLVPT